MRFKAVFFSVTAALLLALFAPADAHAGDPPPLSSVPVPTIAGIENYIQDNDAAVMLGKAFFWDMQVGSDGLQACATCHFQGGADVRAKNTLAPSGPGGDGVFDVAGPNQSLTGAEFPFTQFANVDDSTSAMVRNLDDVIGSEGIRRAQYENGLWAYDASETSSPLEEPVFTVSGKKVRQVTGRNAPSVINAAFYFSNFWDGRARNIFNGVNPFGANDPDAMVWVNDGGVLSQETVRLENSSLASQAVGPPMSIDEMAFVGRDFTDIGTKLLFEIRGPLAKQLVHPNDSVLGPVSAWPSRGLESSQTYESMIQTAFNPRFWDSEELINGKSQMEANFTLFWGLAVQAYQRTLISDQSRFDLAAEGQLTLTPQEQNGLGIFTSGGSNCAACHAGAEMSAHTVSHVQQLVLDGEVLDPAAPTRSATMVDGRIVTMDVGFFNIGVRPMAEDIGRGANFPGGEPLSFTLQNGTPIGQAGVDGAVKTPGLRNIELNGPYMHTGSMATLMQVVDFYARGGDFGVNDAANDTHIHDEMKEIGTLIGDEQDKQDLVAFLLSLTDPRVKNESAPFDHPQLFLAAGSPGDDTVVECTAVQIENNNCDEFVEVPAVGAMGRSAEGLPQLTTFLDLDPFGRNGEKLNSGAGLEPSNGPTALFSVAPANFLLQ